MSADRPSDAARRVASVYPVPGKRKVEEAKILSIKPYKLPWLKIALLGLGIEIGAFMGLSFCAVYLFDIATNIAVYAGGLYAAMLGVVFVAAFVSYTFLARWAVRYPLVVACFSAFSGFALYMVLTKDASVLLGSPAIYRGPLSVIGFLAVGPLLLMGFTFIMNKVPRQRVWAGVLAIAVALFVVYGVTLDSNVQKLTRVHEISWALKPTYLPAGVVERTDESCAGNVVYDGNYKCSYYFDAYPGYLSATSQAQISKRLATTSSRFRLEPYEQPNPFFVMHVVQYDKLFDRYKFKNEKCDILHMSKVADSPAKYRTRDAKAYPPQGKICVPATTPGGKMVYYDAPTNDPANVQVPTYYYFEQGGVTVMVFAARPFTAGFTEALYMLDSGFQPEVYKFIDGIK